MSQPNKLTVLGAGTGRLAGRKRGQARGPTRDEVKPGVTPGVTNPVFGVPGNVFQGTLLAEAPEELDIKVTKQEKEIILAQARRRVQNLPGLSIEDIHYTIMSFEELEAMSVFKVRKTDEEGLHTVNDPRGGVVDNDKVCRTCTTDSLTCPGHLGMIELNEHIIHPLFRREVIDILISVCNSCGGLLLPKDVIEAKGILELTGSKRLRALAEASKGVFCLRSKNNVAAGATPCIKNPIYKTSRVKEVGKIFYTRDGDKGKGKDDGKEKGDNMRTVADIENIFNAISDEDALLMGFENNSHPRRFIMKALPVIPICARAPVIQDGLVLKDDLTSMYLDIVRYNQELLRTDLTEIARENIVKGLLFSIEHLMDNADNRYRQGKLKPYLDIKGRIQGKEAIIRNLIQGKRVNYSARTVLGPDPNLKFGQIRIPRVWAPYLTYPETVSASNIGRLTKLFQSGRVTHITPARGKYAGRRLGVDERIRTQQNLTAGDVVDRWLQDGDYVAFNRQPTLHKQGFMGYEVVLGDPLTIGLHLSYTPPHNADFDGDEGTVHAPQSQDAMLELALLMSVKNCIMNSQNNKNIIGVVMDSLTGAYLLTQPETYVSKTTFMNITSFIENDSGRTTLYQRLVKYHVPITSGRALFSSILPEDFYYNKGDVLIRDGILVSGIVSKDHLGSTHGSIVQVMMKDYGDKATINFLTDIYNIVRQWLDVRGFSVGLDDCFMIGDNPEKSIQYEVERAKMLVKSMGWKLTDPLEEERREKQVIAYLNTAKGLGARISEQNLDVNNAFNVMAKSGAKGSTFNIAQITGMLGQQFVQGQRMPEAISDGTRCLPYFPENSLDPAARGFCANSFLSGLRPAELFFHQAGGREGLTDTAIKTAETGAMHHRVVKALEDVKVYEDGSARNAFGVIFQYIYGEDGFDAAMLETVNTKTGPFTSFINTKRLAGRINTRYGYTTPGEPKTEEVTPVPVFKTGAAVDILEEKYFPPVPPQLSPITAQLEHGIKIGDIVRYQGKEGIVQHIEGERVSVQTEGEKPEWIKIEKLEI
jgi:DNA-directed RNA polymerase II subunit RPB1